MYVSKVRSVVKRQILQREILAGFRHGIEMNKKLDFYILIPHLPLFAAKNDCLMKQSLKTLDLNNYLQYFL